TVNVTITNDTVINVLSLNGLVTAPVKDTAPDTTGIDESQYTGTVTWQKGDGASFAGNFAPSTVYKAIVTLTAKTGYTLTGVAANCFTYTGAAVTNAADSGTVTITFPATGVDLILLGTYPGTPTVTVEGDLIKSITTTAGEILIGRKVHETLTLKIDSSGVLQFRDAVDGSIPIGSYAEFQLINTTLDGAYKQDADIDLLGIAPGSPTGAWSGQEWTPVGTGSDDVVFFKPFIGTFDGDGKSISNLYINSPTADYQGLFGFVGSVSEVKNVYLRSGSVSGNDYIGGIAGWLNALISDCSNNSSVSGVEFVGGVAGYNSGVITDCSNSGSVSGYVYVGGVAGYNTGASAIITDCSNSGSVSGHQDVGGVVGFNCNVGVITDCSNSGSVSGSEYVGGVVGHNYDVGVIIDCINNGPVTGAHFIGGVAGGNNGDSITACTNSGSVTGVYWVGGVAGENINVIIASSNSGSVSGDAVVGGVAGENDSTIIASSNSGSVTGTGGLVGGVAGDNYSAITASYNTGSVSGSSSVGYVAGGNVGTITACYWATYSGAGVGASDGSGTGTGGTTQFSGVDWPDESIVTGTGFSANAWGIGTGTGIGAYWKSLGGWNGGGVNTVYPKLYWE
ncbi:GLUG motif-containing protein, partial [Treponema primitia]|uniref:GLUG motif-containing protein n=1 Tax=Treponema primitia TaxID=88058 RepID=UPI0002555676